MRTYLLIWILILTAGQSFAQRTCFSAEYQQKQIANNPSLADYTTRIETFIQRQLASNALAGQGARIQQMVIRIPVVVHILYHLPGENISDQQVYSQIEMLNKCFRRLSADSSNTPSIWKSIAADCEIEFYPAISDPRRRSTTGILHKYTAIPQWEGDDAMKFTANTGDDAWDPQSYLNIWVCNLRRIAGYSSVPGDDPAKDGVVIDYTVFGPNVSAGYDMGKTAVHEIGHWLGLKHIWGDAHCGDDLVHDTPTQRGYTSGCPTGIRLSSCSSGPTGDMYMNYMDYTNDQCTNLFTEGQKARMRTVFAPGGHRYGILSSKGLSTPLIVESPLPDEPPKWLHPNIYPNPASNELTLDIAYDVRWIGKIITILNVNGQVVMQVPITSKVQVINIGKLRSGLYILSAKKEDGSFIKQKFIKI
jgi:hypothetical protein